MLVATNKFSSQIDVLIGGFKRNDRRFAVNRISSKHWSIKLKRQLARDEIDVAADLCRKGRGQQTMNHQPPLFVWDEVMHTFIARDLVE